NHPCRTPLTRCPCPLRLDSSSSAVSTISYRRAKEVCRLVEQHPEDTEGREDSDRDANEEDAADDAIASLVGLNTTVRGGDFEVCI
ncbi:hypothetical protein ACFQEU_11365, partial [Halorubrum tibetense]